MEIKKILFIASISLITLYSCSSDDSNVLSDSFDNGAILEVVDTANNIIFDDNLDGLLDTTVEYRDAENGSLLGEFRVYITYLDNTEDSGDSTSALVRQEVLLRVIESSTFENGQDGFPRHNLVITTQDFLAITNNTLDGISAGDEYIVRFEILLTDGRIFSINNTGSNGGLTSDFNVLTPVQ